MLVLGSATSSNTRRLVEIAESAGARAFRITDERDLAALDLSGIQHLGVTSGASTPEEVFTNVKLQMMQNAR